MRKAVAVLAGLLMVSGPAGAAVLEVPAEFETIQGAVDAASAGDTVRVAPGVYRDCTHPCDGHNGSFSCVIVKSGVTLLGAGAGKTTIDTPIQGLCVYCEDAVDVVIQGFTFRNADDGEWLFAPAILCRSSSPRIRNCDIVPPSDGGVAWSGRACPVVQDCTFLSYACDPQGRAALADPPPEGLSADPDARTADPPRTSETPPSDPAPDGDPAVGWAREGVRLSPSPLLVHSAPNPFRLSTTIVFGLTEPARVTLRIYDVTGREIASLVDCPMSVGTHEVTWDGITRSGLDAASGTYFYRLTVGNRSETGRMVMVR